MTIDRWHVAKRLLHTSIVTVIFLLMLGATHAGEPFAVLELFTSQG